MIYIIIGYMWLFIHRPFEVWPVLAAIRLERIYMILAMIAWATSGRIRWISNPLNAAIAAFSMCVLACWAASPWLGEERPAIELENYFKLLVFYVMVITTVRTVEDLELLCLGFLGSMGLFMLHSFREFLAGNHVYRMDIPRMVGVGRALNDPNSFSASITYALPFALPAYAILKDRRPRWRILLLGYVALSMLCIVLTGSRAAFVGLLALVAIGVVRSRMRLVIGLLAAVLLPVGWLLIPPELKDRFYTIIDPSAGPANAQESADSRSEGFRIGMELWRDRPLTGAGPGAWRPATGRLIESHNLYGQVAGEMGTLGVVSFGTIVLLLWSNARAIKRLYQHNGWPPDFVSSMADAVGLALFLMLMMGWGAHSLFRFNWLWYAAFVIIARERAEQGRALADGLECSDPDCLAGSPSGP